MLGPQILRFELPFSERTMEIGATHPEAALTKNQTMFHAFEKSCDQQVLASLFDDKPKRTFTADG